MAGATPQAVGSGRVTIQPLDDVQAGEDTLLRRSLTPPGAGLMATEVRTRSPDLADRADSVVAAGGLAVLLNVRFAWRTDLAGALAEAVVAHWPALALRRDSVRLAIHEAAVNAMIHGCLGIPRALRETPDGWMLHTAAIKAALADPDHSGRPVLVTIRAGEDDLWTVQVQDRGPGFSPPTDSDPAPGDAPALVATGGRGRGLTLMRAVADTVRWSDSGRRVEMTFASVPKGGARP
ncbi:ATP-binding protein [Roseospira navarrensis]|uniref:Histidine kinase/HSP90-like ATPase domain-containing protein n=1 Tax=Roseospira navarrensis TaxID=140058 RepID=A0A7X1ZGW5_9PROT|nr:ATP-binding protein [Roseospira navarrensis]MQX38324.1 hypothetical protein [Roseospira navarrensis]